jgi:hypothetical protein
MGEIRALLSWECMMYVYALSEEPAKLNRNVALRALSPNSLCSKVLFGQFFSQNNPLILVGFYQSIYQFSRYLIGFSYEKPAGLRNRQFCLLDKSCRKMYTIYPRCSVNRVEVWRFDLNWYVLIAPLDYIS